MKYRLLLLSLLLVFSISAFAQIQSEQGKVVLTDGQVIEGRITYFHDNPIAIKVYDTANNKQTFEPGDVDKITLDNGRRFVAKKYRSSSETNILIFQELVVSDYMSLYKREMPYRKFYVYTDNEVIELENNETTIEGNNGKRYSKMDHKYVGTLMILMQNRTDLIEKIQKTKFNEKSLASIVTAYTNGNVSYYFADAVKEDKKPYFQVYAHYTNHAGYYGVSTTGSTGFQVGVQYYFSSETRHSIRLGLDISNYEVNDTFYGNNYSHTQSVFKYKTLSFKYQYDFVKEEKLRSYLLVHILDVGHMQRDVQELVYNPIPKTDTRAVYDLRFSPGVGFELYATQKVSLFAEVNHLFHFQHLPKNVSIGIKYSYRKL